MCTLRFSLDVQYNLGTILRTAQQFERNQILYGHDERVSMSFLDFLSELAKGVILVQR